MGAEEFTGHSDTCTTYRVSVYIICMFQTVHREVHVFTHSLITYTGMKYQHIKVDFTLCMEFKKSALVFIGREGGVYSKYP